MHLCSPRTRVGPISIGCEIFANSCDINSIFFFPFSERRLWPLIKLQLCPLLCFRLELFYWLISVCLVIICSRISLSPSLLSESRLIRYNHSSICKCNKLDLNVKHKKQLPLTLGFNLFKMFQGNKQSTDFVCVGVGLVRLGMKQLVIRLFYSAW